MTKEALEALISHLEFWALIFGAIVVIGVGGESIYGVRIWWNTSKLREIERAENAALQLRISQANDRAASAESQIAQANERAKEAEARAVQASLDLAKLKTPRSLNNHAALVAALMPFKGTEYTFSSVYADEESIQFLKELDGILQQAGWKKVKPPGGFPAINVYGKEVDFAVPSALTAGIRVSIDSDQPLTTLQALPIEKLPQSVRAAIALDLNIFPNLSPPEENGAGKKVDVQPGNSKVVRIAIGKKP